MRWLKIVREILRPKESRKLALKVRKELLHVQGWLI